MKTETQVIKTIVAGEGEHEIRATLECNPDEERGSEVLPVTVEATLPGGVSFRASVEDVERLAQLIENVRGWVYRRRVCADHGVYMEGDKAGACPGCTPAAASAAA